MQGKNWIQKLADGMDLTEEPLPKVPVVEIIGDTRVLIECHENVIKYDFEEICVRTNYGTVSVYGNNLKLIKMTQEQAVIAGLIDGVSIQRRVP